MDFEGIWKKLKRMGAIKIKFYPLTIHVSKFILVLDLDFINDPSIFSSKILSILHFISNCRQAYQYFFSKLYHYYILLIIISLFSLKTLLILYFINNHIQTFSSLLFMSKNLVRKLRAISMQHVTKHFHSQWDPRAIQKIAGSHTACILFWPNFYSAVTRSNDLRFISI